MENLNNHREAMATALNTVDQLFNNLQVTYREKEVARERFSEVNYWLTRLYARLEQEYAQRVEAAKQAIEELPVDENIKPHMVTKITTMEDVKKMAVEELSAKPKKKK